MIGFTVLGGYLGVGKTTLLNNILRNNLPSAEDGSSKRIALLINDFGDINIDAKLIQSQTDNQINLANGCVCCTLTDGFTNAVETLLEASPKPDHIIVEASGVADVNNLSQYGHSDELKLASIIVVADAETVREKAHDKYVAKTIQRQLRSADLILLNKVDLIDESEVDNLTAWLAELTEGVPVACSVKCRVPMSLIFDLESRGNSVNEEIHAHEHYDSWSFSTPQTATRAALETFMQKLDSHVLRCKGVIVDESGDQLTLQVVGNRKVIERQASDPGPDSLIDGAVGIELVAIGMAGALDTAKLDTMVQDLLNNSDLVAS
jgi:G3E family GTPase